MIADPIAMFREAFERAKARETFDATAMTLATVDPRAAPSARMVLLKAVDERGFVFHTNRNSRKGHELDEQRVAALVIHWPKGEEQVRIEGRAERISDEESDAYFASRDRRSQIGAWASLQSEKLASREDLLARYRDIEREYDGKPVPRPPHWGGYRVVPRLVEFWKGSAHRLHERRVFKRNLGPPVSPWTEDSLYP